MPVQTQMAAPPDLAGEYLRGVQIGGQIKAEKERLNAAAVQQQQEQAVQQQRIRVADQYHQEQIALRKQQLDQIEQVNAQKTAAAARQFSARQQWEQGFQQIDANDSMSDEQKDAAKRTLIMRLAPAMGTPGTEAASMIHAMQPPKATVPASVEDKGEFMQVTQPNGSVTLHPKPRSAGEKDPNVKVVTEEGVPPTTMSRSQALLVIPSLPPELQTNAVNKAVMAAKPAGSPAIAEGTRIRVKDPNGKPHTVPSENLEKFLENGWTRAD